VPERLRARVFEDTDVYRRPVDSPVMAEAVALDVPPPTETIA
jgi:hypothetical protein